MHVICMLRISRARFYDGTLWWCVVGDMLCSLFPVCVACFYRLELWVAASFLDFLDMEVRLDLLSPLFVLCVKRRNPNSQRFFFFFFLEVELPDMRLLQAARREQAKDRFSGFLYAMHASCRTLYLSSSLWKNACGWDWDDLPAQAV